MPRLDLNLAAIAQARNGLGATVQALDRSARGLADAKEHLKRAQRDGASANVIGELTAQVGSLETEHRQLAADRARFLASIGALSQELLLQRDPAQLVTSLDGALPVSLFPVRLETRFFDAGKRLRIRIYPDAINTLRHAKGLTAPEREIGERYWNAKFAGDEEGVAAIWRDIVMRYRAPRAAWIVRVLQPTNINELGQPDKAAVFPEDVDDVTNLAKQSFVTALPDRFCAIGYAQINLGFFNVELEVFRVWGSNVPDVLPLGPNLDETLAPQGEADKSFFAGENGWLADFNKARGVGMAIEVTDADVAAWLQAHGPGINYTLASGLTRLLVVGVDWTLTPEQSADALAEVLEAQAATAGLSFVPLGTPTNNTGGGPSGFSSIEGRDGAPPEIVPAQPVTAPRDALDLIQHAFGLPVIDAEGINNAGLSEQRTMFHMVNALWRATIGNYLINQWNEYSEAYVNEDMLRALRKFAVSALRPLGPLPTLRVGKQPYGMLPVVSRGFQAAPGDSVEKNVTIVLNILRKRWSLSVAKVPRLIDGNVERVKDILQTGPWAQVARWRHMENPNKCMTGICVTGDFGVTQSIGNQGFIDEVFAALGVQREEKSLAYPLIRDTIADPKDNSLAGVPWVQADPADTNTPKRERTGEAKLDENYITKILAALDLREPKAALNARQDGQSLLEAMLAFAAEEEFDRSLISLHDSVTSTHAQRAGSAEQKLSTRATDFINIEPRDDNEAVIQVRSTRELAGVAFPAVTGRASSEQYVAALLQQTMQAPTPSPKIQAAASELFSGVQKFLFPIRDLSAFRASLVYLADRPVGELDWAFRSTLDTFSHRLDAWFTGLANHRLELLRTARPTGVHLGAYGWVEDLKPDQAPDSLGYVLAPSITQAATAAVLRSGHLANHEAAKGAFNIDLTSARVKQALALLDGMMQGQQLTALLGYRFERALRDAGLATYALPFRKAYPLRPAGADKNAEPQEKIAARDVVDAVRLLDDWSVAASQPALLAGIPVDAGDRSRVGQFLDDVAAVYDALSDVLMSEGVYQLMQGNMERASAAMGVTDKQNPPIEPRVTATPRAGVAYAQRLAVVCEGTDLPAEWGALDVADPRAAAEPALNAWVAGILGDPARFEFTAGVMRGDALDQQKLAIRLDRLGISPLSLVLAAQAPTGASGNAHSALRQRIAVALSSQVQNPDAATLLLIDERNVDAAKLGLAEFEAVAGLIRVLIENAHPLTRKDVVVPRDEIEKDAPDEGDYPGVDVDEIESRAAQAVASLTDYLATLDAADSEVDIATALADGWPFPIRESAPAPAPDARGEPIVLAEEGADADARLARARTRRDRAVAQLQAVLGSAQDLDPVNGKDKGTTHGERTAKAIARVKLVFGQDFPVLPRFTLGAYAGEIAASLSERTTLLNNDDYALAGWLPKLSKVREGADRLGSVLTAREALLDFGELADLQVYQLPHRAGQVWSALPAAWKDKDPKHVVPDLAMVIHGPGALQAVAADTPLAGLLCDEWQEFLPSPTQTVAVSFQYDAPGARPPQTLLLAVPPRTNMDAWSLDDLLATVNEAFDLAKLRSVRPNELELGLGSLLPMSYLPQAFSKDVASVPLWKMTSRFALELPAVVALGKI